MPVRSVGVNMAVCLSVDQNQMKAADCILLFVVSVYFFEFDS